PTRCGPTHIPRAHQQSVTRHLRVGGIFTQRTEEHRGHPAQHSASLRAHTRPGRSNIDASWPRSHFHTQHLLRDCMFLVRTRVAGKENAPMAWQSFVAVGDSFTEGIDDPHPETGVFRGWADLVAERLAVGEPTFRYANLAVRGRLFDRI